MYVPATDRDISAIVGLMNRAYRSRTGSGWSTEEAYLEGDRTSVSQLRDDLARKPSAFLLTWQDEYGPFAGSVWLEPVTGTTWYLGSLAIDPGRQNAGLGRAMLDAAEHWARSRGAERMRLSVVNVREALIAWYGRRGYRQTGEIEPFPYGDDRYGRPLRADLGFLVLEKALTPQLAG